MATLLVSPEGQEFEVPDDQVAAAREHGWVAAEEMAPAPMPELETAEEVPTAPAFSGRTVTVRAPDGELGEIPEENLAAAQAEGFEAQTTLAEDIRTGAEGLARGASLHISDAIQAGGAGLGAALGNALYDATHEEIPRAAGRGLDAPTAEREVDLYSEEAAAESLAGIRLRQQQSPTLATTTEVVGAVAPAILAGGATGALSTAAKFTPAGATTVLAARVQAALATKMGTTVAGRLGALAVAGGVDAAAQSATQRVVDDLIASDFEISAERMAEGFGGVVEDAALGVLMGGAIGGAVEGGSALYGAGKQLAGRFGKKAPAAVETAPAAPMQFDLNAPPEEAIAGAGPLLAKDLPTLADNVNSPLVQDALRAARGSADDFDDVQQAATREVRDDYDEILKLRSGVNSVANIGGKRAEAAGITGTPEQLTAARAKLNAMFEEVEVAIKTTTELDGYQAALQDGGGLTVFKRIEMASEEGRRIANQALDEGRLGDAFMVGDDFKRLVGKGADSRNSIAKYKMRDLYDRVVLPGLQDETVFGDLAVKQKPVNSAWSESIRRDSDDLVQPFQRTSGERAPDPFDDQPAANSKAIGSLLNDLGRAETEATEKAFRMHLRAAALDAQTRAAAWGGEKTIARAQRMTELVERIEARMNAVALAKQDQKAWQKLMGYAPGSVGGVLKGAAKLGRVAAGLEKAEAPLAQRIAQSAVRQEMAIKEAADATEALLSAPAVQTKAANTNAMALPAVMTVQAVQRVVSRARALQDERSPESARLRQASLEVAHDDPTFASVLEQKERQKAAFLAAKAGPAFDDSDPLRPGQPALVDPLKARKVSRYAAAVNDPGSALKRVGAGKASPEDLEVLRNVYPRMFDAYVTLVQKRLERTKIIDAQQRRLIHYLTGAPTKREQAPDYIARRQAEHARSRAKAEEKGSTAPMVPPSKAKTEFKADGRFASRSDQMITEGADG